MLVSCLVIVIGLLVTCCQTLGNNRTADRPPKIELERAYNALVKDQLKQGNFYLTPSGQLKPKFICYETGCPAGKTLMRDLSVRNESNGCGSYNIHIDFSVFQMDGFNSCCDRHDVCYQNCDQTKNHCDDTFEGCLQSFCDRWTAREAWGEVRRISKSRSVFTQSS